MKPEDIARERAKWRFTGDERPPRAVSPGPGQESVWDYPRPPRVEPVPERIRVAFAGETVADSSRGLRVLETASPAVYYLPREDVRHEFLRAETGASFCEWKGRASYFSLEAAGRTSERAAWCYAEPDPTYASLRGMLAFNAGRVDACFVGDERVTPQPGGYYGGWVTDSIAGPIKGIPGSQSW